MLRWLNGLFAALFLFGAVVQYNDPDPLRWALFYLAAAVTCGLGAASRLRWPLPAAVALAALAWAATLLIGATGEVGVGELFSAWEMKDTRIEEGREMYGLLIIAAWMSVLAVALFRARGSADRRRAEDGARGAT